jgi:hypothetical protein
LREHGVCHRHCNTRPDARRGKDNQERWKQRNENREHIRNAKSQKPYRGNPPPGESLEQARCECAESGANGNSSHFRERDQAALTFAQTTRLRENRQKYRQRIHYERRNQSDYDRGADAAQSRSN